MMATKIQNKHLERQKLKKDVISTTLELKLSVSFIMYSTLLHYYKSQAITFRDKNKLSK